MSKDPSGHATVFPFPSLKKEKDNQDTQSIQDAQGPRCPMCKKPTLSQYKPFCSKRCADLDLGQWLKGGYSIPSDEISDQNEDFDE